MASSKSSLNRFLCLIAKIFILCINLGSIVDVKRSLFMALLHLLKKIYEYVKLYRKVKTDFSKYGYLYYTYVDGLFLSI
jgi:hypothetical protein